MQQVVGELQDCYYLRQQLLKKGYTIKYIRIVREGCNGSGPFHCASLQAIDKKGDSRFLIVSRKELERYYNDTVKDKDKITVGTFLPAVAESYIINKFYHKVSK